MKKRLLCTLLVAVLSISTLTGCQKQPEQPSSPLDSITKEELLGMVNSAKAETDQVKAQLAEKEDQLAALMNSNAGLPTIVDVGNGDSRLTFVSRDAKVIFSKEFKYPGSEAVKPDNKVQITSNVSIVPSTNWTLKFSGTNLELENSSGISGIIKVGSASYQHDIDTIRDDVIKPWFSSPSFNGVNVKYSNIYLSTSDAAFGVDASAPIMIDKQDASLRCGMLYAGGVTIVYTFVYRTTLDTAKDSEINSLLNTLSIGGNTVEVK